MRPLTKNTDNEQYFVYSPSSGFLPSVALGALLKTNLVVLIEVDFMGKIGKIGRVETAERIERE